MTILKVFAVDDERGMTSGIERALQAFTVPVPEINSEVQLEVETAVNGEDAVEYIRANEVDILLLDYKLPGINGLDVLQAVSGLQPEMLTIIITAYASIETAIVATKRGAYDFLPKPFTPADLKHLIRKAVTRIMLARETRRLEAEKRQVRFEFIRVLGHELKAPIGAVAGYLYLMRDRSLGAELPAYDEAVDRSLTRLEQMRKLIADLLDMTRLESGQKKRTIETVKLADAVKEAVELVSAQAAEMDISISVDADAEAVINADRGEIAMMLNNLFSNAVKYNRRSGSVDIAVSQDSGATTITVLDTGIGMSEKEQELLFREFSRIKNSETRNVTGSGLGLSILKKLAGLYNGEVSVISEKGKGSTFTVILRP